MARDLELASTMSASDGGGNPSSVIRLPTGHPEVRGASSTSGMRNPGSSSTRRANPGVDPGAPEGSSTGEVSAARMGTSRDLSQMINTRRFLFFLRYDMRRRYRKCPPAGESAARAINRDLSDELSRVEDKLTQKFSTRKQSVDQGEDAEKRYTLLALLLQ